MPVLETACPLDCPDSCSLEATVEKGRVVQLEGSRRNPLTQGFICSKVRRFPQHVYGPERILAPGLRTGCKGLGQFRFVSWDEALNRVVEEIEAARARFGAESVLPFSYGGSNGLLTHQSTDRRFFHRLGASRLARTVCAAPTTAAATGLYGKMAGVSPTDYRHAELIVVWGANPSTSGIHFVPPILEAKRRGAKLVVVDPRRINLAKKADLHLALRPGTDLPVALSVVNWLFENGRADLDFLHRHADGFEELRRRAASWDFASAAETAGIDPDLLQRFARLYADASPAVIRCGWGLERNRNGGSAVAAVLSLPAVAGKFGVRGGGYTLSNSGAWKGLSGEEAANAPEPDARIVNMNHLGRTLLEERNPPIKVLFVYNCNPLATMPEQELVRRGLERKDVFTVVFDQVLTDTARYADLALPATTFLEHRDLARGYGAMTLQETAPVIDPVGEARSNFDVFAELCRRMGLERPEDLADAQAFLEKTLESAASDGAAQQLKKARIAYPAAGFAPVQFRDVFPKTADRKIHLLPESLDREAPEGLYGFQPDPAGEDLPLALISPATNRTISSSLGQLYRKQVPLEIHPSDAARRRIRDGEEVRVFNRSGEVRCLARVTADVRRGTVFLPKGLWSGNTLNGKTANALAPDSLTDLGQGACFNDARVEVQRASKQLVLDPEALASDSRKPATMATAAPAKSAKPRQ